MLAEREGDAGGFGGGEGGEDGVETVVVALGGVGGMEAGVSKAVGLGDDDATGGHGGERGGEAGEVESELALKDDGVHGGLDDGAAEGGVGEARVEGASALLGAGDEACTLAVGRGAGEIGSVESVRRCLAPQPRATVENTNEPTLHAA